MKSLRRRWVVAACALCGWISSASADEPRDAGAVPPPAADAPAAAPDPAELVAPPSDPDAPVDRPEDKHGKKHKHNDTPAPGAPGIDGAPAPDAPSKPSTKKKGKKKYGKLEFGGRMFVRAAAIKDEAAPDVIGRASVPSARVKVKHRWHEVQSEIELEVASKVKVKNAFAQLRLAETTAKVDVRAGNFKMPFSAIQESSIWSLPMADRGLLDNVLVNRLQVAGRAIGGMVIVELPGGWSPELRAGVFQGVDDAGNPLSAPARDRFGQNGVLRVTAKPVHGLTIGLAGEARIGQLLVIPVKFSRGYAGELDVTVNMEAGPGQLRVWVEGMLGTSWLVAGNDPAHVRATFREGRGIAAWRVGGAKHGKRYAELYGLFGALDPDSSIRNDLVVEATGGLTYGAWNAWRVQAELERWQVASNAPIGIVQLGVGPATSTTFLVQIGARL